MPSCGQFYQRAAMYKLGPGNAYPTDIKTPKHFQQCSAESFSICLRSREQFHNISLQPQQRTWQQPRVRPVRVLGKQPGVFISFALIASACEYLKRENMTIALVPQLSLSWWNSHPSPFWICRYDLLQRFALLWACFTVCLGGELRVWAASCAQPASTLDLNLYIFHICVAGEAWWRIQSSKLSPDSVRWSLGLVVHGHTAATSEVLFSGHVGNWG